MPGEFSSEKHVSLYKCCLEIYCSDDKLAKNVTHVLRNVP